MFYHKTCSNHVSVSDERSQICTVPDTEVLKNPNYHFLSGQIEFFNQLQQLEALLTRTVFCFPSEFELLNWGSTVFDNYWMRLSKIL